VELQNELHAKSQIEMECRKDLKDALALLEQLQVSRKKEQEKAASCVAQFESLQKKNRELKGERNNLSRKNESLSKEISRICRDGRTIRDVEKMIADHDSLKNEVVILRTQKRKALEEAQLYRKLYEQVKAAEQLHGVEEDTRRALQRTTELERLLLEMTDYVHAKEMQLETMKQVNEALQEEIKNLAKASFQKNDV
jgi:seryl-tRNA synthetase